MKTKSKNILNSIIAWFILCLFVFPIFWLITSSFKTPNDIFTIPPKLLSFEWDFSSYSTVFGRTPLVQYIKNSLIICSSSVTISIVLGTFAAYAFSRFNIKRSKDLSFWIISVRMAPPIVAIVPLFILINKIGLYDSHISLILIYLMFNIPFAVWMMRGYLSQIPVELDEAARIEGCSHFITFFKIIFPLIKTGVITTAIMSFIFSWNEFFFAFLLTGRNAKTVPVGISGYITQTGIRWDELTTAGTVILIPILVLSLFASKHFIKGLMEGALKD